MCNQYSGDHRVERKRDIGRVVPAHSKYYDTTQYCVISDYIYWIVVVWTATYVHNSELVRKEKKWRKFIDSIIINNKNVRIVPIKVLCQLLCEHVNFCLFAGGGCEIISGHIQADKCWIE